MSTRFTSVVFVLYKLLAVFAKGKDRLLLLRRNIFNCIVLIFSFPWWSIALLLMDAAERGAGLCGGISSEIIKLYWGSNPPSSSGAGFPALIHTEFGFS